MKQLLAVVMFSLACMVTAEDAAPRHGGIDHGGNVGVNGVKQTVALRINKLKQNTDAAIIQLDLGDKKYPSTKPDQLVNPTPPTGTSYRPTILLTIGSLPTMTGVANAKGVIVGELFTAKLTAKGAGMKITIKKGNLNALLSNLSGKGDHAFLTITVQDDHVLSDGALTAAPRHAHSLFTQEFELEVKESDKSLTAKN